MDIKYQKLLNKYPSVKIPNSVGSVTVEPLSIVEIKSLEDIYNSGTPFPSSLRELLYLAGNDCYFLDYGIFKSQKEIQEKSRIWLNKYNRSINRPFFVIDVYNAGSQFLFVYLDSGVSDPEVFVAYLPNETDNLEFINSTQKKLSEHIERGIKQILSGQNPF